MGGCASGAPALSCVCLFSQWPAVSPSPALNTTLIACRPLRWRSSNDPVALRTGIGHAHDAASTSSKEAQTFYDQGLAYLHSYTWIEAARSFHVALKHDPKLALAHVGLSVAFVELNRPGEARKAIDAARGLAAGAS